MEELGLREVVTFLGWRHDVPELMSAVDVVVQPSLQEAFSQSMAEAMLLGRPLIATNVSGVDELIPADAGIVVPPADAAALTEAISLLHDPQRRAALAEEGKRHASTTFTVAAAVARHDEIYCRITR